MLIVWIVFSVAGVIALPSMIVALVNDNWLIAIPCITIVAFDFYGLPMGWISWVNMRALSHIVDYITEEGITELRDIAAAFDKSEKTMRATIKHIFSKGYLRGYKWNPEQTKLIPSKEEKLRKSGKCDYCGAVAKSDTAFCEYCGAKL